MKDLYTFDISLEAAQETYSQVAEAYKAFFDQLKLPIIVAEASSGDMGGNHSHEYHLPHAIGSDTVLSCDSCGYAANDEVAVSRPPPSVELDQSLEPKVSVWRGITKDRKTLVNAWYYNNGTTNPDINIHAIKSVVPDLDTSIAGVVGPVWAASLSRAEKDTDSLPRLLNVVDSRLASSFNNFTIPRFPPELSRNPVISAVEQTIISQQDDGQDLNLASLSDGDGCPRCESGSLTVHRALELGHTFVLGTRYSKPLEARVTLPQTPKTPTDVEMGCYGIGVSRIFGAVAEHMADNKGLNWPRAIAPFEVIIIPTSGATKETLEFYDILDSGFDVVLDDRKQSFGRKIKDADTTGYPVTIILGTRWGEKGEVEVQCRRLSLKERVAVEDVATYLKDLLGKL